jgi:hypothetical protein
MEQHNPSAPSAYRAEFFNMLNKPNFGYPNTRIGGPTAGTIRSVGPARQMQFALRLRWKRTLAASCAFA